MKDKKYLAWVRTRPCSVCGNPDTVAHHGINIGIGGAMGAKTPDLFAISLCVRHHTQLHARGYDSDQYRWIVQTLAAALQEGVIEFHSITA